MVPSAPFARGRRTVRAFLSEERLTATIALREGAN
jgi:hypothetical protein